MSSKLFAVTAIVSVTIGIAMVMAGGVAVAGPISALYLTAGDQQHIDVIQGNSVINQFNEVHSAEYPIAVQHNGSHFGLGLLGLGAMRRRRRNS